MCLLIEKPKGAEFDREWLSDFWLRNKDGAGVMFRIGKAVHTKKICSPSLKQWLRFYDMHAAGRECFIHLRMRTHGSITLDNVHPYPVARGIFLMHNGVLATGNAKDRSKSDTWHFINDYLAPMLRREPKLMFDAEWQEELGSVIGLNNRFALLGPKGAAVINRKSGVEFQGAWLSNTYAWSSFSAGVNGTPSVLQAEDAEDEEEYVGDSFSMTDEEFNRMMIARHGRPE